MSDTEEHTDGEPWPGLELRRQRLRGVERIVADYVAERPERVVLMSALQLAEATGTSDATVIRMAKSLGFSGYSELKHEIGSLLMRRVEPSVRLHSRLDLEDLGTPSGVLGVVLAETRERLEVTERRNNADDFARALHLMSEARRVVTFGVGTSQVCADYATRRLRRLGIDVLLLTGMGFALADEMLALRCGDVGLVFAPGRRFREAEVLTQKLDSLEAGGVVLVTDTQDLPTTENHAVLRASLSPGGISGEVSAAIAVTDALVLGLGRASRRRATETSAELTALRGSLQRPVHTTARATRD